MNCIRCGGALQLHNCAACTWPYSPQGWCLTTRKVRRLTLDTGCVNARGLDPHLNKLEEWQRQGLIELQRSKAFLEELTGPARVEKGKSIKPHPPTWRFGFGLGEGSAVLAAAIPERDFLRSLLFPTSQPLTPTQEKDIEHLQYHVHTGGDLFVTGNPKDFIHRGKQEALWSIGIWAFTPEEVVQHLRRYVIL